MTMVAGIVGTMRWGSLSSFDCGAPGSIEKEVNVSGNVAGA
jgi:hypothetical protein